MRASVCALVTVLATVIASTPNSLTAQARSGVIKVPDATIAYEVQGSGTPLVFVHGYAQNMTIWDDQLAVFAPRYQVVRYDVRGFGRSTGNIDQTTAAADLAMLLDSLGIRRAAIVGLSMGSQIALNFAVNYPDRVNALVLYGAPPTNDYAVPGSPQLFALFSSLPNIMKAHGLDSVRKAIFASELAWNPPNRPDIQRKMLKAWEGYTGSDLANPRPPSGRVPPTRLAQVNDVRVPTLVIHGDHEVEWFRQFNDTLMARLPNARRVVIENAGHGAHFAEPGKFNRAVVAFLESAGIR